jgi:hypothetical protein
VVILHRAIADDADWTGVRGQSSSSHLSPTHASAMTFASQGAQQSGLWKHEDDITTVSFASADALSAAIPLGLPANAPPDDTVAATAQQYLSAVAQGKHGDLAATSTMPFT